MYLLVCSVIARSFFFYILCDLLVISEVLSSMYIYVLCLLTLSLSLSLTNGFFLSIYKFVDVLSLRYIIGSANGCTLNWGVCGALLFESTFFTFICTIFLCISSYVCICQYVQLLREVFFFYILFDLLVISELLSSMYIYVLCVC